MDELDKQGARLKWACVFLGTIAAGLVIAFAYLVQASQPIAEPETETVPIVYDNPATGVYMTVSPARTDGELYDLPDDIHQQIVCDHQNREYMLLTTDSGGVAITPLLDENGEQKIMPQA